MQVLVKLTSDRRSRALANFATDRRTIEKLSEVVALFMTSAAFPRVDSPTGLVIPLTTPSAHFMAEDIAISSGGLHGGRDGNGEGSAWARISSD